MAANSSEIEAAPGRASVAETRRETSLLISIAPLAGDALETVLGNLSAAFSGRTVMVAASEISPASAETYARTYPSLQLVADEATLPSSAGWVLTAADFVNLYKAAQQHDAQSCLVLGAEAQSLSVAAIRSLAAGLAEGADLAVPHYQQGPREGLVNSALLYPLSRAVFGTRPRFPLAVDLGLSLRMAARVATIAQRFTAANQNDALLWPVVEAAAANYSIVEIDVGTRKLPQPATQDLNSLLAQVVSSLFAEVETRASFWQRARVNSRVAHSASAQVLADDTFPDVQPMLESFRIAYTNLHEVWSLVLPPNSLLGLKRLSQMPPESFRMGNSLWARIVYDFILAYRLRTINRGHLLGALTPLYLAWVASHILLARAGTDPEQHIEEVALAFETDKPYLVSRWRWPDRFNP